MIHPDTFEFSYWCFLLELGYKRNSYIDKYSSWIFIQVFNDCTFINTIYNSLAHVAGEFTMKAIRP
jgi:hypothetical protein